MSYVVRSHAEIAATIADGGSGVRARVLEGSKQVQAETRTVIDVPYGDDYWQKVDFYLPEEDAGGGLPVLLFIHGGAWRHGYKEWMGFMAPPVIRHPAVFVSVSCRLAPDAKFPDIAEDCFDALALVYRTVAQFGGDAIRRGRGSNFHRRPFGRRASGGAGDVAAGSRPRPRPAR